MPTRALGRVFDLVPVVVPVADLAAGNNTGKRIHLKNYGGVAFVLFMGAVSAGTDTYVPDVQQHTAASGGTSNDLDSGGVAGSTGPTVWFIKNAATLDGTQTWSRQTQSEASEISLTGATYAANQVLMVVEVLASQLADGYEWVSMDLPDAGAGGTRPGGILAILFDLPVQRTPQNLVNPQA